MHSVQYIFYCTLALCCNLLGIPNVEIVWAGVKQFLHDCENKNQPYAN